MRWLIFCFWILVLISFVFAQCNGDQIDVNSASLEEIENIYGIGPVKAQAIIDSRPFEKIEDLIEVRGIGEKTFENIKNQGLACVHKENEEEIEKEEEKEEEKTIIGKENKSNINDEKIKENQVKEEVIYLSPKNIKRPEEVIFESRNEKIKKYGIYGFAIFCIFLIGLLIRDKNG
jgi:competence ComEA-like helix-hairpin-helix protein